MQIEHHFLTTCHDIIGLFKNVNKISTFCTNLEKQANLRPDSYSYESYVGDGFEFLIEILIKSSPCDNRIGITNYHPVKNNVDNGVDGYGINLLNKKCSIQVKYRNNKNSLLTSSKDGLDSFMTESMYNEVFPENNEKIKNHYIFTTAEGLHHYTNDVKFRKSIKCIGYQQLRELLDNNINFWNFCRDVISQEISKRIKPIINR